MGVFLLFGCFLLQTTVFGSWAIKPELFLIALSFIVAGRGLLLGLLWGCLYGVFLDIYTGYAVYHAISYALLGMAFGLMPEALFRDHYSMLLVAVGVGSIALQIIYPLLVFITTHTIVVLPWYGVLALLIMNLSIVMLLNFFSRGRHG